MRKNLFFRLWFYFRQGWSTYFAFIFAAINTLTVTYYLAIQSYPDLSVIFPTFTQYVAIITVIGIPLLVLIGYVHFKRSSAFKAEADINIEANPHFRRILVNTELLLPTYLSILELMIKLSNNEKMTNKEVEQLSELQKKLTEHVQKRVVE